MSSESFEIAECAHEAPISDEAAGGDVPANDQAGTRKDRDEDDDASATDT